MKATHIRSLMITGAVVASLTLGGVAAPVYAQAQSGDATGQEPGMQMQDTREDDGGTDWGWIGLLGLAGLAGLRGRKRDHDHTDRPRP